MELIPPQFCSVEKVLFFRKPYGGRYGVISQAVVSIEVVRVVVHHQFVGHHLPISSTSI